MAKATVQFSIQQEATQEEIGVLTAALSRVLKVVLTVDGTMWTEEKDALSGWHIDSGTPQLIANFSFDEPG